MAEPMTAAKPGLNLRIRNFTSEMASSTSCVGWFTFEDMATTIGKDGRVTRVDPRVGGHPLTPVTHGVGPQMVDDMADLACARFCRKELDYLSLSASLPGTEFTLIAAAVVAELFPNSLTLMAVSHGRRFIRIAIDVDGPVLRHGSWEVRAGLPAPPIGKPFLIALACSSGTVRAAIWEPGRRPDQIASLEQHISLPVKCDVVLGAECVGDSPDAPTPSAPRSWDGGVFDFWVFDHDLLTDPADSHELTIIGDYIETIFGKSLSENPRDGVVA